MRGPRLLLPILAASLVVAAACEPRSTTARTQTPSTSSPAAAAPSQPAAPPFSDDPVIAAIVELGRTDSHVADHERHLVEVIGPRLSSSHQLMEAERWCRDQLAGFGLDARLEAWGEFPVGFDRGPWSGAMVAPERLELDFITPAWTPGVFGPVRGPALAYPASAKAAGQLGEAAAGAWILVPREFGDDGPSAKEREAIDAALTKLGVAGFVRRARGDELVHTSGRYQISWEALPTQVTISVRGDQWDAIAAKLESSSGAGPVELEFAIDNRFFRGPVPQHNVIADLVGTEFPDEVVIVGGHLDSWDGARGAVDNATGVSTTLEAARLLMAAGARPRRTIRFMLWTGEEQGLLGSKGWVDAHPEELAKISAVLVHDGGTNYLGGIAVTPEMLADAKQVFEPLTRLNPELPFGVTLTESLQTGGSDHTPFIRQGAPGFFWDQHGRADYDHAHHTQYDTLDAVVPEYQEHSAMVVAISAWNLAQLDHLLPRDNSAPFDRRELGVELDEMRVTKVEQDSVAAAAGWRKGDEIVSLVGAEADASRWAMFRTLQAGEPIKEIVIRRKGKDITTRLDWSQTPTEIARRERAAAREAAFGPLVFGEVVFGEAPPEPDPDPDPDPED